MLKEKENRAIQDNSILNHYGRWNTWVQIAFLVHE